MFDSLIDSFNEPQRAAIEYCDGASLVVAGAGSGKTRVLTYKIAYLLEHGYEPWSILSMSRSAPRLSIATVLRWLWLVLVLVRRVC